MKEDLSDELINGISLVEMSSYREKVLNDIKEKIKTPSRIAKSTSINPSHVSTALKELMENELVVCLNPEKKQGRIYRITKLGKEVLEHI